MYDKLFKQLLRIHPIKNITRPSKAKVFGNIQLHQQNTRLDPMFVSDRVQFVSSVVPWRKRAHTHVHTKKDSRHVGRATPQQRRRSGVLAYSTQPGTITATSPHGAPSLHDVVCGRLCAAERCGGTAPGGASRETEEIGARRRSTGS